MLSGLYRCSLYTRHRICRLNRSHRLFWLRRLLWLSVLYRPHQMLWPCGLNRPRRLNRLHCLFCPCRLCQICRLTLLCRQCHFFGRRKELRTQEITSGEDVSKMTVVRYWNHHLLRHRLVQKSTACARFYQRFIGRQRHWKGVGFGISTSANYTAISANNMASSANNTVHCYRRHIRQLLYFTVK